MKALLANIKASVKQNPHQVFVGLGVFFTVIMGTSVQHVASGVFGLFFLISLLVIHKWKTIWQGLTKGEKWFLFGFACYAASGVVAYINVQDVHEYIKVLERYLRFLLAIPMYLYIRYYKINVIRYLYAGAIVSGPFLLAIALNSYFEQPELPAHGHYHHIIFGSVAMLNVGVMLVMLVTMNLQWMMKVLLLICMFCGVITAVLSQSRGVWLVLPAYLLIAVFYALKDSKPRLLIFIIIGTIFFGSALLIFQGDIIGERIDSAKTEISSFYSDNRYNSSLGARLAMWDIALDVWREHPVVGTGPGDFDGEIRSLQKAGKFIGMDVFASTHNIFFQALVSAGMLGLFAMLLALFYMPYRLVKIYKLNDPGMHILMITFISAFMIIGLGESWTLRLSITSVYVVFCLVIVSSLHAQMEEKNLLVE